MATTNVVRAWIYKVNQRPAIPLASVTSQAFPASGTILIDCFDSPTRALETGVSVYCALKDAKGNLYYTNKTIQQMIDLFNA